MSTQPLPSEYHDPLTALPNRRLLDDRLKQALHLAQRRDCGIALMLVELAAFGRVADEKLCEAARSLGACLRKADTLARWGAAEFAAVLTDVEGDADALVRNADAARSRARQSGRRQYRFFAR